MPKAARTAHAAVLCRHRAPPEGHHAVAHVFIDGALLTLDDFRQPREHLVQKRLQLQRGMHSDRAVKPRMSQNITVSSRLSACML